MGNLDCYKIRNGAENVIKNGVLQILDFVRLGKGEMNLIGMNLKYYLFLIVKKQKANNI